jgi:hypothetical protein
MANLKVFIVVVVTIAFYTMLANAIPQVQSQVPEDISFGATCDARGAGRRRRAALRGRGRLHRLSRSGHARAESAHG